MIENSARALGGSPAVDFENRGMGMIRTHASGPLLHDILIDSAKRFPNKVALVCQNQRLTYSDLDEKSNALANVFRSQKIRRGDRILVFGENSIESAISFWAALKANAIVSLISPLTREEKLVHLLNDCSASLLVADAQLTTTLARAVVRAPGLRSVIVYGAREQCAEAIGPIQSISWASAIENGSKTIPCRESIDIDLAALIYTSGSTGAPKGVMLTHRNMMSAAASITEYLEITENDVILNALPLSFDYGLYQMIMTFKMGARLILESSFAFPSDVIKRAVAEKATGFPGVPTMFALMAEMKALKHFDLSSFRFVTNTAAALPLKHILMLKELFPKAKIFSMYGLTECKRCTYLPPEDIERKPNSVGIPIPNTELWVVDELDRRLGPNEIGQLVVRGATVMRGYWNKPEETSKKLRPGPLPGELVLYTGDLCKFDDEGYLYFVGRMDDVIKSRGEKVPPKEVEVALLDIPGVREAAVIGIPDEINGQAIKAFVVTEEGVNLMPRDILRMSQKVLEPFMVPKQIVISKSLPKTSTGKIDKNLLS